MDVKTTFFQVVILFLIVMIILLIPLTVSAKELVFPQGEGDIRISINLINSSGLWNESGSNILPHDATLDLQIPSLVNCDTIDTDADGVMSCGTDATGAGLDAAKWVLLNLTDYFGDANFNISVVRIINLFDFFQDNITSANDSMKTYVDGVVASTVDPEDVNLSMLDNATINRSIDLSSYNQSIDLSSYNHSIVNLYMYNYSLDLSNYYTIAEADAADGGGNDPEDVNLSMLNNNTIIRNHNDTWVETIVRAFSFFDYFWHRENTTDYLGGKNFSTYNESLDLSNYYTKAEADAADGGGVDPEDVNLSMLDNDTIVRSLYNASGWVNSSIETNTSLHVTINNDLSVSGNVNLSSDLYLLKNKKLYLKSPDNYLFYNDGESELQLIGSGDIVVDGGSFISKNPTYVRDNHANAFNVEDTSFNDVFRVDTINNDTYVYGTFNVDDNITVEGNITFEQLKDCDTINTDSTGLLTCGDDASGAGVTVDVEDVNLTMLDNETILRINNLSDISLYINSTSNASLYQLRVTGTCAVGSSIRVINSTGGVKCEADDSGGGAGVSYWEISGDVLMINTTKTGGIIRLNVTDLRINGTSISEMLDNNTINRSVMLDDYNQSIDLSSYNSSIENLYEYNYSLDLSNYYTKSEADSADDDTIFDSDTMDIVNTSILDNSTINRSIDLSSYNHSIENLYEYNYSLDLSNYYTKTEADAADGGGSDPEDVNLSMLDNKTILRITNMSHIGNVTDNDQIANGAGYWDGSDITDLDWANDWMIAYSDNSVLQELTFNDASGKFLMSNGEAALSWEIALTSETDSSFTNINDSIIFSWNTTWRDEGTGGATVDVEDVNLTMLDNKTIVRIFNVTWVSWSMQNDTINRSIDLSSYNYSIDLSEYNKSIINLYKYNYSLDLSNYYTKSEADDADDTASSLMMWGSDDTYISLNMTNTNNIQNVNISGNLSLGLGDDIILDMYSNGTDFIFEFEDDSALLNVTNLKAGGDIYVMCGQKTCYNANCSNYLCRNCTNGVFMIINEKPNEVCQ